MSQAARNGDMHSCPLSNGNVPHVGGPILPGANSTVLIDGIPASVVGDSCICVGSTDSIIQGSTTVLINGTAAARLGDATAHGGSIIAGSLTVMIG